jgi:hypothetical protein
MMHWVSESYSRYPEHTYYASPSHQQEDKTIIDSRSSCTPNDLVRHTNAVYHYHGRGQYLQKLRVRERLLVVARVILRVGLGLCQRELPP